MSEAMETLGAIKWFYENELVLYELENKPELTDAENVKCLRLRSEMMGKLRLLQEHLPKPFEEIIELMRSRIVFIENILGRADCNHAQFLRAAVPRMEAHLQRLRNVQEYGELKVAVDTIVNEFHWGWPLVSHITRHVVYDVTVDERKQAVFLAKEICILRDDLCLARGNSKTRYYS